MGIFITATDTNVGKTTIAAWITLHTNASYWKPIQTGNVSDKEKVAKLSSAKVYKEAYSFKAPLSPFACAMKEKVSIDPSKIIQPKDQKLIIEGAGGILVPITPNYFMIDLIKKFARPVLIISRSALGTLNHTFLTLDVLRSRDIPILGVILTGPKNQKNKEIIEELGKVKVLDEFFLKTITKKSLMKKPLSKSLQKALKEVFV